MFRLAYQTGKVLMVGGGRETVGGGRWTGDGGRETVDGRRWTGDGVDMPDDERLCIEKP
ncbi:MAG: hypothetical protein WCR52_13230 [Bacteroidota bacterium]